MGCIKIDTPVRRREAYEVLYACAFRIRGFTMGAKSGRVAPDVDAEAWWFDAWPAMEYGGRGGGAERVAYRWGSRG